VLKLYLEIFEQLGRAAEFFVKEADRHLGEAQHSAWLPASSLASWERGKYMGKSTKSGVKLWTPNIIGKNYVLKGQAVDA
jgi:hypothetical protein